MKTIKLLLTATAVAIVAIATAVEKPKMNVTPLSPNRAVISITNENLAYFQLSIETKTGDVVYYKESSKPLTDYKKVFDFTKIEKGIYVINLKVNDTQLSKKFQVHETGIYVGKDVLRFDPYFTFNENVLKFSYLNVDEEKFNLNIYNKQGLVYQTKLGKDVALTSGYDLSKLETGNYEVILSSFSNEFVYSLER